MKRPLAQAQANPGRGKSRNARRRRNRRGGGNTSQPNTTTAPFVVARTAVTTSGSRLARSGVDRFYHVDALDPPGSGALLVQTPFCPAKAPGLARFSSLYQRVRYHNLRFEIRTSVPTTTSGGYIAAFIRDPDDLVEDLTGEALLSHLTGTEGAVQASWWSNKDVVVNQIPDLYYTGGDLLKGDRRRFCPGKFVLACDGKPNQPLQFTILVHWSATFEEPALLVEGCEAPKSSVVVELTDGYRFWSADNSPETTWKTALCYKDGKDPTKYRFVHPKDIGLVEGGIYRCPKYIVGGAGNGTRPLFTETEYLYCTGDDDGPIVPAGRYYHTIDDQNGEWRVVSLNQNIDQCDWGPYNANGVTVAQMCKFHPGDIFEQVDMHGAPMKGKLQHERAAIINKTRQHYIEQKAAYLKWQMDKAKTSGNRKTGTSSTADGNAVRAKREANEELSEEIASVEGVTNPPTESGSKYPPLDYWGKT